MSLKSLLQFLWAGKSPLKNHIIFMHHFDVILAFLGKCSNLRLGVYIQYAHENSNQSLYLHFYGIKCYPCQCVRLSVRPKFGVRSISFERLHRFNSNLVCWYIISKHRSSPIWVTIHYFGPFIKTMHLAGASVSYGLISSLLSFFSY